MKFCTRFDTPAALRPGIAVVLFLSLAGFAFGADPVSAPPSKVPLSHNPREREAQAVKFVQEKLQLWQHRMNLTSWDIQANLIRRGAFKPKTIGGIHWDADIMKASIDVLSTYDYTLPDRAMLDDMEFTVVHELVHLQLSSLPRSEASRGAEEHAVNEIARALLKLAKH
jgi:hypothetical protein